ncbi:MAG: methylenetetrahydrofolate reductase [Proteobacteria bacterium]|nr:methylenetetrahydrofolate reductase [Pseudomonadota bacterium]MBU1739978.1 methylenetetrahydrofolate reductase [Pseudomonadota bacterium]
MMTDSPLEKALAGKRFVVTAECGPPKGADAGAVLKKAAHLKGLVDGVNVTDNQTAVVRLSSWAACVLLKNEGHDPILQMTVRDRNRIALQSDLIGAFALGIQNVLCLSGDHVSFGNQPGARGVHDLDSVQLVRVLRRMRDEEVILGDEKIDPAPRFFIGAAANPFARPVNLRPARLAKKVAAGADFIQTQCIYNLEVFEAWLDKVRDMGLCDKAAVLAGVTPLKSAGMAKYMRDKVPGMDVPDEIVRRLEGVAPDRQADEGIALCVETIERLRELDGVRGVHLMAIEWEHKAPEILKRAGLAG